MKHWILSVIVLFAGPLYAVTPGSWQNQSEADFATGEFEKTAVNSRGEVSLTRAVKVLVEAKDAPVVVSAVAVVGKDLYAASGADGDIYKVTGEKAAKFATVPGTIVACLTPSGKTLLAGTGGKGAGIYSVAADGRVAKGKVTKVWSDPAVHYVWAIAIGDKGVLYAATSPKATVFEIKEGKGKALYEISKHARNILSLAVGAGGKLYAGTDRKGLVLEIDLQRKAGRVILDAAEKEIAAIIPDADGGLFVATSDAAKASADGKMKPTPTKTGKSAAPKAKAIRRPAGKVGGKPETRPAKPAGKAAPAAKTNAKSAPKKGKAQATAGKEKQKKKPDAKAKTTARKTSVSSRKRSGPPPAVLRSMSRSRRSTSSGRPTRGPSPSGRGNAVYYIQSNGLVRTIFRKPVTILAMVNLNGTLLLGTGNGGAIYRVSLDGDVSTKLADTDARQVTSLAVMGDGRIAFATANKGSVATLGAAPAPEGTFTSKVMDAKQIAQWGTHSGRASVPPGTKATFATRSGNLSKADEATWSPWSPEKPLADDYLPIRSPAGRFLQYRLKLTSRGKASPVVHGVHLIYQVGNLAPALSAVTVKSTASRDSRSRGTTGPKSYRHIAIAARDPNGDKISFTVEYRPLGGANWIRIGKDLTKPVHVWDTRTVGDGDYEIRVTASDKPANPPAQAMEAARIAEPVRVDNTPPVLKLLAARAQGKIVSVRGQVADATSRLAAIRYAVDSAEKWVAVLPTDGISDSRSERFSFEIDDLKPGPHGVTVQARDLYGNVGTQSTTVVVPEP